MERYGALLSTWPKSNLGIDLILPPGGQFKFAAQLTRTSLYARSLSFAFNGSLRRC